MPNALVLSLFFIFVIQVLFFAFAAIFKTDKVTDLAYGLTFVFLAAYFLITNGTYSLPELVLVVMIGLWGIRLSGYLFYRILKMGRDKRFDGIRENVPKFASFWSLQTVSIWIVVLPAILFMRGFSAEGVSVLMWLGVFVWTIGFLIETAADCQQNRFYSNPENKGRWNDTGLWKHSRHPNYFGEILCWWGIFLYVFGVVGFVGIVSPVFIMVLLLFISGIPPTERKSDEKYGSNPEYTEYKERTSALIPLPNK